MKLSIETVQLTNLGDHGERLRTSHEQLEGETVEALVRRVFPRIDAKYAQHDPTDEVVIRVVVEDG